MTFAETLAAAINDLTEHGFDSVERVDRWVSALRSAARGAAGSAQVAEDLVSAGLAAIYQKLVDKGGISRYNPGVARFTLERVRPQLRAELDRRIVASAQLIKRNKDEAVEKTLQRFQGWATSIPAGGGAEIDKRALKSEFSKPIKQMDYRARVVTIDQGAKLVANITRTVAEGSNAIAGVWSSQWRRAGYQYRKDHKERDGKVYLIRDSWAHQRGLVKPGSAGFTDKITQPAEEVFCSCSYRYLYALRALPEDMVTEKGRAELQAARDKVRLALQAPGTA